MNTNPLEQAHFLNVAEQIKLVETNWDGIARRDAVPPVTEAQKTELDRRLAEHVANPGNATPWSEVKAAALARIKHRAHALIVKSIQW